MNQPVLRCVEENPVIAAVRDEKELEEAVSSPVMAVFLLRADIFNLKRQVDYVRDSGKCVLIHLDFLEGLGNDHRAVDYIAEVIRPDGIISTKSAHVKYAKGQGLFAIQRFFIVDSLSYENLEKTVQSTQPDMIEVMPGIMPRVIRQIAGRVHLPVIAGGLVSEKSDIFEAIKAGAMGVSTSSREIWKYI